jgi:hypothetical protein
MTVEFYNVPVLRRILTVIIYLFLARLQICAKLTLTSPHLPVFPPARPSVRTERLFSHFTHFCDFYGNTSRNLKFGKHMTKYQAFYVTTYIGS